MSGLLTGVFNLAAGLLMVGLGAWLLWLNASNRVHRAFAYFLFARGLVNVAFVGLDEGDAWATSLWALGLAVIPFATLYFLLAYRTRAGVATLSPATPRVLALAGLIGLGIVVLFLPRVREAPPVDEATPPMLVFYGLLVIAYLVVSIVFLADAATLPVGPVRSGLLLVSAGFALNATFQVLVHPMRLLAVLQVVGLGDPLTLLDALVGILGWAGLAALLVTLTRAKRKNETLARPVGHYRIALGVVLASALVLVLALFVLEFDPLIPLYRILDGLWTLALPLLVTYAIVRHQLFDLDVKIKWTIRQGTVAAVFVAVFFIVSEAAQEFFGARANSAYIGIFGAGALVFALSPLQRFADRLAHAALPNARPVAALDPAERLALYRDQARVAWADGTITTKERELLRNLRERLGLDLRDAAMAEEEITAGQPLDGADAVTRSA